MKGFVYERALVFVFDFKMALNSSKFHFSSLFIVRVYNDLLVISLMVLNHRSRSNCAVSIPLETKNVL